MNQNDELKQAFYIAKEVHQLTVDRQATQPILLDLSDFNSICSMMMIVSFPTQAQARSFANEIDKELSEKDIHTGKSLKSSPYTGWTILDYGEIFIHVMDQETRDYYQLEELWRKAKQIDPASLN